MGTKDQAAETFERWRACRSLLNKKTRRLQKEMEEFLGGDGAMPTELLAEVLELQKACVALFEQLVSH